MLDEPDAILTGLYDNRFILQPGCFCQGGKVAGSHSIYFSIPDILQRCISIAESNLQCPQILDILPVLLRYDKAAAGVKVLIVKLVLQIRIGPAYLVQRIIEGLEQRLVPLIQRKVVGIGRKSCNGAEVIHNCHVNLENSIGFAHPYPLECV